MLPHACGARAFALAIVKRRVHLQGHAAVARVLAVVDLVLVLSVVAFAVVASFWWALTAFWIVGTLRSVREPARSRLRCTSRTSRPSPTPEGPDVPVQR
jgi:hypothetical protein